MKKIRTINLAFIFMTVVMLGTSCSGTQMCPTYASSKKSYNKVNIKRQYKRNSAIMVKSNKKNYRGV